MMSWLKKLFGIAGVAATAQAAQATPENEWTVIIEAARDLSDNDVEIENLIKLASVDPDGFEAALNAPPYSDGKWFVDYVPGDDPAGSLFRDVMMAKDFMVYLDWKEGSDEIFGHYDAQMRRRALPELTETQKAEMNVKPPHPSAGRLYFTDFIEALDADAVSKNHRVLSFDEGADSYAFFVVTPQQFDRWHDVRFGPNHRFFSPTAFFTDQTR